MSSSDLRRAVQDALRAGDVARARELALKLPDPWYRCQSLALVAAHLTYAPARTRLIDRAFEAAKTLGVPNRIVTVSSWPLGVLDRHGDTLRVARETERLLTILRTEPHPIRRMDALCMLRGAVASEPTASLLESEVLAAAFAGHGWKRDATIAGRALAAARVGDHERARSLWRAIELPRSRRRAARDLRALGVDMTSVSP